MQPARGPSSSRFDDFARKDRCLLILKVGQNYIHKGVACTGKRSHPVQIKPRDQLIERSQETDLSAFAKALLVLLNFLGV